MTLVTLQDDIYFFLPVSPLLASFLPFSCPSLEFPKRLSNKDLGTRVESKKFWRKKVMFTQIYSDRHLLISHLIYSIWRVGRPVCVRRLRVPVNTYKHLNIIQAFSGIIPKRIIPRFHSNKHRHSHRQTTNSY